MWVAPFPTNWALDWVKERKLSISVCVRCSPFLTVVVTWPASAAVTSPLWWTVITWTWLKETLFFPKLLLLECCIAATETKLRQTEVYDSLHPL